MQIPSLPLTWRDAAPLLTAIHQHGVRVPENWQGGVPDIGEWWTGDASSPIVHLMNLQDEVERQPIRNVIGRIMGYESPEKIVYAGNHRDAWCFGAVDPGSGTAVMLEVVRVFGELVRRGWRPRRTIVFASWDAEEYNLIGSTEHVEEGIDVLRQHAVAYLNVDSAVSGKQFRASGNPVFEKALTNTLGRVMMPEGNETALSHWTKAGSKLEGLGAGSDYVAFQGKQHQPSSLEPFQLIISRPRWHSLSGHRFHRPRSRLPLSFMPRIHHLARIFRRPLLLLPSHHGRNLGSADTGNRRRARPPL